MYLHAPELYKGPGIVPGTSPYQKCGWTKDEMAQEKVQTIPPEDAAFSVEQEPPAFGIQLNATMNVKVVQKKLSPTLAEFFILLASTTTHFRKMLKL